MTKQEKREDTKMRIVSQLKRRVRPHRGAAKVLEIAIALAEERVEMLEDQKTELIFQIDYMKNLKPAEIEQDET